LLSEAKRQKKWKIYLKNKLKQKELEALSSNSNTTTNNNNNNNNKLDPYSKIFTKLNYKSNKDKTTNDKIMRRKYQ
jgi:hypothetical protein